MAPIYNIYLAGKRLPPKQLSSTQLQTNNCHPKQLPPKQLHPHNCHHTFRLIQTHPGSFKLIQALLGTFGVIWGHSGSFQSHLGSCVVTIVWVAIVSGGNCLSAIVWMTIVWVAIVFQPTFYM